MEYRRADVYFRTSYFSGGTTIIAKLQASTVSYMFIPKLKKVNMNMNAPISRR